MNVLVIGSGGREHALIWKISQSDKIDKIFCAPGNAGISQLAQCVDIKATDVLNLVDFAKSNNVGLTVVGPEDALMEGIVDVFEQHGLKIFGPQKNAAIIEGSKVFSKNLMKRYAIPTAEFEVFDNTASAINYLESKNYPIVVKAEGLALGKGVIIAQNSSEAKNAVIDILDKKVFGDVGGNVVIEEFLVGREVSVLAFCDGNTISTMPSAQDHKRVFDGDKGLNTGGMGAFSPSPFYSAEIEAQCYEDIFKKTIDAMSKEGRPFKGVLYFGLILTDSGAKVIEYNARFGDPETQAVISLLKSDIVDIFEAVIWQRLDEIKIEWEKSSSVCIVAASGGYPGKYATGFEISGLDFCDKANVFHAGTKLESGAVHTSGGRVLGVTAISATLEDAAKKAYDAINNISFEGIHYRRDIGRIKK